MALYAIGDLHLSFGSEKPMDIFGEGWIDHHIKVKENWGKTINENDTVLITGDTSWGLRLADAMEDLEWINNLPGKKIFIKGNHDYWWQSVGKMKGLFSTIVFLQNDYYVYEDYAICGARGWNIPGDYKFTQDDKKIFDREIIRMELSLEKAKNNGHEKIIVMMHYPPINENNKENEFTQLFKKYEVEKVIYAHLHGKEIHDNSIKGYHEDIDYYLTACDYLECMPMKIL